MASEPTPLEQAQTEAVENLARVLDEFASAIQQAAAAGLEPADALEAAGIAIPPMAKGMVNLSLGALVEAADESPI